MAKKYIVKFHCEFCGKSVETLSYRKNLKYCSFSCKSKKT